MTKKDDYLPVPWVFREMLDEAKSEKKNGAIHFFIEDDQLESYKGVIGEVKEISNEGEFVVLTSGDRIRLDKIITLYGKPGPAFDKYDAFANACLDCKGGYDDL